LLGRDTDPQIFSTCRPPSGRVWTAHELQSRFHAPPGFSLLLLPLFFAGACLLSSLSDGSRSVSFEQLSRIILDFGFSHPHGAVLLLSFSNTGQHENS
jgi:hypothetical protein